MHAGHVLAMSAHEHTLWVWAIIIGFVVVLAVAALLSLLIYLVKIIDRRVPEAGRATSGTSGSAGRGVTSATISSAIPYSSGRAPATTPPVWLMCSTPGPISLAWPTMARTRSPHSSRLAAILVSSEPTQYR